jgi:hypothetical protein
VAAPSEGGGVEVNSGSATMTKSLRKRMAVACPADGVEAATCSEAGDEAAAFSGAGIEDGRWQGGGAAVSRVTVERERERGPEILVRASPFS